MIDSDSPRRHSRPKVHGCDDSRAPLKKKGQVVDDKHDSLGTISDETEQESA
jgi:hypothetical protein